MKNIHKITISFKSSVLSNLSADGLMGQLFWTCVLREGEESFQKFLGSFLKGDPPFLLSDGFPSGFLPRIISLGLSKVSKKNKSPNFLNLENFEKIRHWSEITEDTIAYAPEIDTLTVMHNRIDRQSLRTAEEGGLYSIPEKIVPLVDVYLKISQEGWLDKIKIMFCDLAETGFGRKKSVGKGQFEVNSIEPFDGFSDIPDANGFVTLSNFCPAADDPVEGWYKTFVKYGKLGDVFTFCGNPFKRPLLMIKTGSVFRTNDPPKEFYGRMVEKISPAKPEVVQYAYAFALPLRLPPERLDA